MARRILVWDLPTRLFHWLLAPLVLAAILTGKAGGNAIVWHGRLGLAITGLLAFRLVWGFAGSTHARFASFFPTPARLIAYWRGRWHGLGHNPFGALSVFGLLAAIAIQLGTGLVGNDDIAFQGFLYPLIDKDLSDALTGVHRLASNFLIMLIGLHLAAIMFYAHVKKDNLVKPMLTGLKEVDDVHVESASGGGKAAFAAALIVAATAVYGVSGTWIATPPPAPPQTATPPAW